MKHEFTHEDKNEYTHRKFIGSTSSLYSINVEYHKISEVTVKTEEEIYQDPIIRNNGMYDMM